jgi:hypothetical protein
VYEISDSAFYKINENVTIKVDRVKGSIFNGESKVWKLAAENYVTWSGKKTTYTITYRPNGATGESITTEAVDFGTEVTIMNLPDGWAKEGSTFDGWHQRQDGDTTYSKDYAAGEKYTGPTMTLYAQWVKQ